MKKSLSFRAVSSLFAIFLLALLLVACSEDSSGPDVIVDGDEDQSEATEQESTDGDVYIPDGDFVVVDGDQPLPDGDKPLPDGDSTDGDLEQEAEAEEESIPTPDVDAYRMDTLIMAEPQLVVTIPGQGSQDLTAMANQQLVDQISQNNLNMMLAPDTEDLTLLPYDMHLGVAERVGAAYQFNSEQEVVIEIVASQEERRFMTEEHFTIEFPLGETADTILVIRDAELRGTYSEEYGTISDGILSGAISETDANNLVLVQYGTFKVTLANAFFYLGQTPDYTFQDTQEMGYRIRFSYTAAESNLTD